MIIYYIILFYFIFILLFFCLIFLNFGYLELYLSNNYNNILRTINLYEIIINNKSYKLKCHYQFM